MIQFTPDTRLGTKYRLLDRLGAGGFGQVWRALKYSADTSRSPQEVALKIIDRVDDEALLLKEPRIARTLGGHSHIVRILGHDFLHQPLGDGMTLALFVIVMEYVPGINLRQLIGGLDSVYQPLHPARAIHLILQVLDALSHAQARGVYHRDVKPENVIIAPDDHVKMTDFGISRLSDEVFTSTVHGWGTPPYMPPELSRGLQHASCDLYAVGMMLYEMLAGAFPFPDDRHPFDLAAILPIKQQNAWIPLCKRVNGLPKTLETVIFRAIDADCNRRYRWAADMSTDLQAILASLGAPSFEAVERLEIPPTVTITPTPSTGPTRVTPGGLVASARAQVARDPTSFEAHFLLAKLLYRQGHLTEAQTALKEATRLEPDNPVAWEAIGDLLRAEGQIEEAIDYYRKAFGLRRRQPRTDLTFIQQTLSLQEKLGELYLRVQDYRAAQRLYRQLLAAEPDNVLCLFRLGIIAALRGNPGLAVQHLEAVRDLRPDVALVHNKLAQAYRLVGDLAQAIATYQRVIELAPEDPSAWLGLAEAYRLQGMSAEARRCLEQVLALAPSGRETERAQTLLAALA